MIVSGGKFENLSNMRNFFEKIESRFSCRIEESLISSVYSFLQTQMLNGPFENGAYLEKELETKLLKTYINSNNLIFNDLNFAIYLDEGAEQKVFLNEQNNTVLKLNDGIFYVNWSQYFESLLIHNILFTETKYDLIGFLNINDILYSVLSQDYIEPNHKTTIDMVRNYMFSKGFSIKKRNDYIHTELGLIIEDLHEENVLVKDDTLFFIDTVIYLK